MTLPKGSSTKRVSTGRRSGAASRLIVGWDKLAFGERRPTIGRHWWAGARSASLSHPCPSNPPVARRLLLRYNDSDAERVAEVPAHLVVATVFKIVGRCVNRTAGGFDSHALPPFFTQERN